MTKTVEPRCPNEEETYQPNKNEIVTVSSGARQIRDNGPSKKPDSDIAP